MECQVPGGEPRVLPLVGHGEDVGVVEMSPVRVAAVLPLRGWRGLAGIALQPVAHDVVVELLRPEHARERLAHHVAGVGGERLRDDASVEFVCFRLPGRQDGIGRVHRLRRATREPQPHDRAAASWHGQPVAGRALGTDAVGIDGVRPLDHVVVDAVLRIPWAAYAEETRGVRFVVAEEQLGSALADELVVARAHRRRSEGAQRRAGPVLSPAPGVAEPEGGQDLHLGGFRAAVRHLDADAEVLHVRLRVLDEHVEIAVMLEDAGIDQLELAACASAAAVLLHQPGVGELRLRILVEVFHVRMRGRGVEVIVELLHVLAVVPFLAREPEQALLQDRIVAVPQRHRKAEVLAPIRDAGDAVLVPPVGARARLVVGDVVPGGPARAVVLAHRAPGALAQIGSPALPVGGAVSRLCQPQLFARRHGPLPVRLGHESVTRPQAARHVTVDNAPLERSTLREMVDQGEVELVASLRQGDEAAFLALVQKSHPSMVRVARVFVTSEAVAEEVALRRPVVAPLLDLQHRRQPGANARAARGTLGAVLLLRGAGGRGGRRPGSLQPARPPLGRTLVCSAGALGR